MSRLAGLGARLRSLVRRAESELRMEEEMRFHVTMATEENERAGMSRAQARRAALIAFGGLEKYGEEMREGRSAGLEEVVRDIRHALRALQRTPAFTIAAVLTLAIGVGVNAGVFSLVSATLLRPLPFVQPERLVVLTQVRSDVGVSSRPSGWSYAEYSALSASLRTITDLSAYFADDMNLSSGSVTPFRVRVEMISASYFSALFVQPARGRAFLPREDSAAGAYPVAVIGHDVWRNEFGTDPQIVGRRIVLNGTPLEVIGVAPRDFDGLSGNAQVWISHAMAPVVYYPGHLTTAEHFLSVIGRLRDGVLLSQAEAEVRVAGSTAVASARRQTGADDEDVRWTAALRTLDDARRDPAAVRAQLVLAGAVFFVLLIGAVNLAGLLLARSTARARETAIRAALGAGRIRLVREALTESALVGLAAGGLGALIAFWCISSVTSLLPASLGGVQQLDQLQSFAAPAADWRTALFAGVLALAAGMAAGLLPALRATRADHGASLRAATRGSTFRAGSLRRPTALSSIAVVQIALALVLLTGAGLLLRSFHRLSTLDAGLNGSNVLTFRLSAPETEYSGPAAAPLLEKLLARVQAVPGVVSATVGRCVPFRDRCSTTVLYIDGRAVDEDLVVERDYVGPDHFRTLGIPLLRGRVLQDGDRAGRQRVAVINEAAARRFWPAGDAIGSRVWFGSGGGFASRDSLTEIVGVVGDVRYGTPGEPIEPIFYTSYQQFVWPETVMMVRAAGDAAALVPALRRVVMQADANLPIYDVRSLQQHHADALTRERFAVVSLGTFAALGLLLAGLGVYGVLAYSVVQRRREIGIRLALGATPRQVMRLVVGQGVALAAAGMLGGAVIAAALARVLSALIADTGTVDPVVFLAVATLLLLVAFATCLVPARAAARVDPVQTLGAE